MGSRVLPHELYLCAIPQGYQPRGCKTFPVNKKQRHYLIYLIYVIFTHLLVPVVSFLIDFLSLTLGLSLHIALYLFIH